MYYKIAQAGESIYNGVMKINPKILIPFLALAIAGCGGGGSPNVGPNPVPETLSDPLGTSIWVNTFNYYSQFNPGQFDSAVSRAQGLGFSGIRTTLNWNDVYN